MTCNRLLLLALLLTAVPLLSSTGQAQAGACMKAQHAHSMRHGHGGYSSATR